MHNLCAPYYKSNTIPISYAKLNEISQKTEKEINIALQS